jgi:hypothetical protein
MTSEAVDISSELPMSPIVWVARGEPLVVRPGPRHPTDWPDEEIGTELSSHSIAIPRLIPTLPPLAYHFDLRQQWEGTVVALEQSEFRASLKDLTNPDNPPEEAVFSTEEVFPGDLRHLVPGAIFRWSIGYRTQGSQKERVSRIQFARLPGWSRRAVERVEAYAAELQRLLSDSNSIT